MRCIEPQLIKTAVNRCLFFTKILKIIVILFCSIKISRIFVKEITTKKIEIMKTITTIEQKESYKKFLEINSLYESLLNLENKELNGWLKRLEPLKIDLCDSIYWEALIDKINEVKNKINY